MVSRSILSLGLLLSLATSAAAQEATPDEEASIDRFRSPVQALTEQFLGSTSRAVRVDWRKSPVALGVVGSELIERNNFGAFRIGGMARRAFGDFNLELGLSYVLTSATTSSDLLALTPYRQAGRPNRFELDLNANYPIAEGVVTPVLDWIPPAELVLNAIGGLRYLIYPEGYADREFFDVAAGILAPQLVATERPLIEENALPGMLVDSARYHLLAGFSVDVYFQPGFFVSPRALIAVPLLAPITGTSLDLWWEMNLVIGYAL